VVEELGAVTAGVGREGIELEAVKSGEEVDVDTEEVEEEESTEGFKRGEERVVERENGDTREVVPKEEDVVVIKGRD
jgi:hypothetical protein